MTPHFESVIGFDPDGIRRIYASTWIEAGQVRELLDIFTWVASFEGCVLRPTWVSYS
jgi:hypothetical protein